MISVQRGDKDVLARFGGMKSVFVTTSRSSAGGLRAVLSEAPAGRARGPSGRRCEGKYWHRDPGLQTTLCWGHLHR